MGGMWAVILNKLSRKMGKNVPGFYSKIARYVQGTANEGVINFKSPKRKVMESKVH